MNSVVYEYKNVELDKPKLWRNLRSEKQIFRSTSQSSGAVRRGSCMKNKVLRKFMETIYAKSNTIDRT